MASQRRLVVEADGGSRGNPGVAGYGALVRDAETGALLAERAEPLGKASNNVAEYSGLIAGLQAARAIEPSARIEVRMDSKLVIEQMAGRWKIKHEDMRRLALQARDIAADITDAGGSIRWTWIPREQNKAADALSNIAMDGDIVDRTFGGEPAVDEVPPPVLDGSPRAGKTRDVGATGGRGTPTRIVLVRHGVTDFTLQGRLDGRGGPDPDLAPVGVEQARNAARAVRHLVGDDPARVITSTLARARQTGAWVADALGVPAEQDADFDEQSFGDWDGVAVHDLLREDPGEFAQLRDDPSYARPGGESHHDLQQRVLPAYERVVALGGTSIVVCHRKPIMVILASVLSMPMDTAWRLAAAPGSLSAIEAWPTGEVSIAFTNRT